jgi:hypothetical protein
MTERDDNCDEAIADYRKRRADRMVAEYEAGARSWVDGAPLLAPVRLGTRAPCRRCARQTLARDAAGDLLCGDCQTVTATAEVEPPPALTAADCTCDDCGAVAELYDGDAGRRCCIYCRGRWRDFEDPAGVPHSFENAWDGQPLDARIATVHEQRAAELETVPHVWSAGFASADWEE